MMEYETLGDLDNVVIDKMQQVSDLTLFTIGQVIQKRGEVMSQLNGNKYGRLAMPILTAVSAYILIQLGSDGGADAQASIDVNTSIDGLADNKESFNNEKWSNGLVSQEDQPVSRHNENFGDTKSMNRVTEINIQPGEIISGDLWVTNKLNNGEEFTLFTGVQEIYADSSLDSSAREEVIIDKINSGEGFKLVDVEIAIKNGELIDVRTKEVLAETQGIELTEEEYSNVESKLLNRYTRTFAGDQSELNRITDYFESRWDDNEQVVGFQIDYGIHPKDLLLKIIESGDEGAMKFAGVMEGDQHEERFFNELTRTFANNAYSSEYAKEMVQRILD